MDLAQHATVLWRFRAVMAGGLVLGVLLALLAAYQLPSFTPRGSETWSSDSSVLVTQAGFPEGRVTLPSAPAGTDPAVTGQLPTTSGDGQEFADPDRLSALATLYAQLAASDRVRGRLPDHPKAAQIQAIPLEGNAGTQLPVIKLTTFDETGPGAKTLNLRTIEALRDVLASEQAENEIPARQRVQISMLNAPATAVQTSGRSHTASILAFLLCLLGSIAVAHLLAALRDREDDEAVDGVVVPWGVDDIGAERPQPEPTPSGAGSPHEPALASKLAFRRPGR